MSTYLKPQSPLYHKTEDAYFYPLTTADQVIMDDDTRLSATNFLTVEKYGATEGEVAPVNADTLGGKSADEFATTNFVTTKIAEAQLSGGIDGSNIDLSGFATKDDINNITPNSIGALSMELLWENASPTSEFAEQDVTIGISEYSMLAIKMRFSVERFGTNIFWGSPGTRVNTTLIGTTSQILVRTIDIGTADPNKITFNKGYIDSNVNNSFMIPIEIYGIKGVSA